MNNLFIAGHGFDVAHGLNTRYCDFYHFILDLHNLTDDELYDFDIPLTTTGYCGDDEYDENNLARMLVSLISNVSLNCPWNDVETALGVLDYGDYLSDVLDFTPNDEDGDVNLYHAAGNMQDYSGILREALIYSVQYFLRKWIESIDTDNANIIDGIRDLLINCSHILNFNYTSTIQDLYNRHNVCHIHGRISCAAPLVFGHNNTLRNFEEYDHGLYFNSSNMLSQLHIQLRKDTNSLIQNNQTFFSNLNQDHFLDNIYSLGFSYNEIDMPYIRTILLSTSSATNWHVFVHGNNFLTIKNILIGNGFTGVITPIVL